MKYNRCFFFLFLLCFILLFPLAHAVFVDDEVRTAIEEDGYADVLIFVAEPLSSETLALLEHSSTLPGQESKTLHKILAEKKKVIQKQQQQALSQMNLEDNSFIEDGISAAVLQRENVDLVLEKKYTYINAISGIVTEEGYEKLLRNNAVVAIYLNDYVEITLDTAIPFVQADFAANLSINGSSITGEGVGICVIDTGIDTTHPDLQNVIVDQYCYCSQGTGCCPNGGKEDSSATDDNGHGTAVTGTIASQDPTYPGIAPGADIIMIKALSSSGSASTADILSGINKCLELAEKRNIKIFSFSFGGREYNKACDSDALASTVNGLVDTGFFVASASGNSGQTKKISTPSCGSKVTAVGAIYDSSSSTPDTPASFSNSNSLLDILAPGVDICTTKASAASASTCYTSSTGGYYYSLSGTSFSTPLVAGAAALIAEYEKQETGVYPSSSAIKDALTTYGVTVLDARNGLQFPRLDVKNTLKHIDNSAPTVAFASSVPANGAYHIPEILLFSATATDSINEIVLCTLSYNGTNSTINISSSGTTATCTASLSVTGNPTYQIFAMDANGNVGSTEIRSLRTENTAPNIDAYNPSLLSITLIIPDNQTFTLNASDAENDTLAYYWLVNGNATGTATNYTFSSSLADLYLIEGIVSDGIVNVSMNWSVNVTQATLPTVENVTIIPSSPYRNDTLNCSYKYSDPENDAENGTVFLWYKNETLQNNFTSSFVSSSALIVGDSWTCAVTPSDGKIIGSTRSSAAVVIQNYAPAITVTGNFTVNETETVEIQVGTTDGDNDTVTTSINDSRFVSPSFGYYYNTSLNSSESFAVLVQANDGYVTVEKSLTITILNALDSDSDTIPDFKDTDDDNDGITDDTDKIVGEITEINVPEITVTVNGTEEENATYTEDSLISLSYNNETLLTFFYNFSQNNLTLNTVIIANESATEGNLFIRGLENVTNKTIFIENTNSSADGICILDTQDATVTSISSSCTDADEFLLACDGNTVQGYSCTSAGGRYMITGLSHSGIIQHCISCTAEETPSEEPAPVPEEEPVEETTESSAAAGGGGGGGAGPTTETTESAAEQTSTSETIAETESSVVQTEPLIPEQETEEHADALTVIQATPYSLSLFSLAGITGSAVADLQKGKMTWASILFLVLVLSITGGIVFIGSFAVRNAHRAHTVFKKIDIREDIFDVYKGFKEFFKR